MRHTQILFNFVYQNGLDRIAKNILSELSIIIKLTKHTYNFFYVEPEFFYDFFDSKLNSIFSLVYP